MDGPWWSADHLQLSRSGARSLACLTRALVFPLQDVISTLAQAKATGHLSDPKYWKGHGCNKFLAVSQIPSAAREWKGGCRGTTWRGAKCLGTPSAPCSATPGLPEGGRSVQVSLQTRAHLFPDASPAGRVTTPARPAGLGTGSASHSVISNAL